MTKLRDCPAEATLKVFTRKFRHAPRGVENAALRSRQGDDAS